MKELIEIQTRLKAPKSNEARGRDGRIVYKYRSCEDILEACKDLLKELNCHVTLTDEILLIGNRFYVKATATITNDKGDSVSVSASSREPDSLSTMNPSQVTGAASSYARKYALNGLFAIDDTRDADITQENGQASSEEETPEEIFNGYAKPAIDQAQTKEDLVRIYNGYPNLQTLPAFTEALTAKRKALGIKNSNS